MCHVFSHGSGSSIFSASPPYSSLSCCRFHATTETAADATAASAADVAAAVAADVVAEAAAEVAADAANASAI